MRGYPKIKNDRLVTRDEEESVFNLLMSQKGSKYYLVQKFVRRATKPGRTSAVLDQ